MGCGCVGVGVGKGLEKQGKEGSLLCVLSYLRPLIYYGILCSY